MTADARRDQLRASLALVQQRISRACHEAGRDRAGVTLVVVTKTYPAADIAALAGLGVRDVGESRDQEAAAKYAELATTVGKELTWHFIGRLQSNKARHVAAYADLVHSVDRVALVAPLSRGAGEAGRRVGVLIQVSLDGDPDRGGIAVHDLAHLADAIAQADHLELRGLMAVAPLGADPVAAFALLPALSTRLQAAHPGADIVSAGMSGDLEAAIGAGATHLRVGTAVLGPRPPLG
jgi:pyridoxal phosphate enzyme (YggS family)